MVILALFGWIVYLLFDTDQFTAQKWTPFEYKGIQELLLRGLGNTLKAFAYAAVLSLALGAVLAVGRLSEHRVLRWISTLLVEFFRAMPVLVMIFFIFVALKVQPLPALVAGLTLYNGSVLAEVFRTGINAVDRGQRERRTRSACARPRSPRTSWRPRPYARCCRPSSASWWSR